MDKKSSKVPISWRLPRQALGSFSIMRTAPTPLSEVVPELQGPSSEIRVRAVTTPYHTGAEGLHTSIPTREIERRHVASRTSPNRLIYEYMALYIMSLAGPRASRTQP